MYIKIVFYSRIKSAVKKKKKVLSLGVKSAYCSDAAVTEGCVLVCQYFSMWHA